MFFMNKNRNIWKFQIENKNLKDLFLNILIWTLEFFKIYKLKKWFGKIFIIAIWEIFLEFS